jgi:aspartate carbamoyltransferase catalytic subunit
MPLAQAPELRDKLVARGVKMSEHRDLSEVIADTDLLYMTRVQREYDAVDDKADLAKALSESEYKLTVELASRMRDC